MSAKQLAACKELFRRGEIDWLLHPTQRKMRQWLDSTYRELAVICISRQLGKTLALVSYCVAHCLKYPRSNVLFVAPHRVQAENYLTQKINFVFSFLPDDCVPTSKNNKWYFPNGSTWNVTGVAVGQGVRMRGDTVDLCVMDEVRDITELENVIESHVSPMLVTTAGRIVLISTPPESPLHAFTFRYIKEAIASNNFFTASYKENPLISSKRLRYLMNVLHKGGEQNPTFRREYLADYSIAEVSKRIVREWDAEANARFFENYPGPPAGVRMYSGLDYAFSDPAGLLVGHYDYNMGCLVIEEEFFKSGCNTDDIGLEIIRMEKEVSQRLIDPLEPIRVCDVDPSLMADLFSRFRLRFEPARKVPSILVMLNRMRVAFIEGKIRIRPRCTNLIFQLQAGIFNAAGTGYLRTAASGHCDLIDALKYMNLNCRWDEIGRPQPTRVLKPNEMFLGSPYTQRNTFSSGIINRPR